MPLHIFTERYIHYIVKVAGESPTALLRNARMTVRKEPLKIYKDNTSNYDLHRSIVYRPTVFSD